MIACGRAVRRLSLSSDQRRPGSLTAGAPRRFLHRFLVAQTASEYPPMAEPDLALSLTQPINEPLSRGNRQFNFSARPTDQLSAIVAWDRRKFLESGCDRRLRGLYHWRGGIMSEAGTENTVVESAANLEQKIGPSPRPGVTAATFAICRISRIKACRSRILLDRWRETVALMGSGGFSIPVSLPNQPHR